MAGLLEGKPLAQAIKQQIIEELKSLKNKPVLAGIQVGDNPASEAYVNSQVKLAQALGIEYQFYKLPENITADSLVEFIEKLNYDDAVNGIIIQTPLPAHIQYKEIIKFVLPEKDAEGMHPLNLGRIVLKQEGILLCTPAAVMELLNNSKVDLYGKEAVIVGHSEIVGKPLALLLLNKFATVTICHIATSEAGKLEEHVRKADILIAAVGKPGVVKGEWIKQGAVVIDVGINRVDGKIIGDVEFAGAEKRASLITPVPGGVGPLTVVMLMRNLVKLATTGGVNDD
ncbi:MAG: bifunctional 5,10-methylenetetrahydrofolate dehydrogenase/5,10-methenyltetrahydrofolate cyclohydrolase [Candidatus Omnitrophota bacterium]